MKTEGSRLKMYNWQSSSQDFLIPQGEGWEFISKKGSYSNTPLQISTFDPSLLATLIENHFPGSPRNPVGIKLMGPKYSPKHINSFSYVLLFNIEACCKYWNEMEPRIATLEFDRTRKSMGVIVKSKTGGNMLLVKVCFPFFCFLCKTWLEMFSIDSDHLI